MRVEYISNFDTVRRADRQVRERILTSFGIYAQSGAKSRCPVKRGHLRGSINYKVVNNKKVVIGTNMEYAEPVHEGHRSYPGVPFLRDTVNQGRNNFERIATEELRRAYG